MDEITSQLVSVPLYRQVEEDLTRMIHDGTYPPGSRLPSDSALQKRYGVSRITVRRALDNMVRSNLVRRRQGLGSFVTSPDHSVKTANLHAFIDEIHPFKSMKVLETGRVVPPPGVAEILKLDRGDCCACYTCVNYAGSERLSYVREFLPESSAHHISEEDINGPATLASLLETRSGRRFAYAEQVMGAVAAEGPVAQALGLAVGHPIMRMERAYFTNGGAVLYVTEAFYHPERYKYSVRIVRRTGSASRHVTAT